MPNYKRVGVFPDIFFSLYGGKGTLRIWILTLNLTWLGPMPVFPSWLWTKLFKPQFLRLQIEDATINLLGWCEYKRAKDLVPKRKTITRSCSTHQFLLSGSKATSTVFSTWFLSCVSLNRYFHWWEKGPGNGLPRRNVSNSLKAPHEENYSLQQGTHNSSSSE